MSARKSKKTPDSAENNAEIRLPARSVSRGVAIGTAVSVHGEQRKFVVLGLRFVSPNGV
jgi:hypothetical protein